MKRIIVFLGGACLLLMVIIGISFSNGDNSNNTLDSVSLEEDMTEIKSTFALMVETSDGSYTEYSSSSWPTDMILNPVLSGCSDENGQTIEDALTYDSSTKKASVNVNEAFACYLYFSYPMTETLISTADLWDNTSASDGYRYIGTDPDNYICLGTTSKTTCLNNSSMYLYRIIGVFEGDDGEYHLKLIKNTALSTSYSWNDTAAVTTSSYTALYWGSNTLSTYLNSTSSSSSYYLYNSSYMTSDMREYIYNWDYPKLDSGYAYYALILNASASCMGSSTTTTSSTVASSCTTSDESSVESTSGSHYSSMTGSTILSNETGTTSTTSLSVGLMTPADFILSMGSTCSSSTSSSCASTLKTSWLYLGSDEWTMATDGFYAAHINSSYDYSYTYYYTYISSSGTILYVGGVGTKKVRPVIYLNADVVKVSGDGSSSSPYIIS